MTVLSCMLRDAALGDNPIEVFELAVMADGTWRALAVTADKIEHVGTADNPATAMGVVLGRVLGLRPVAPKPAPAVSVEDLL